ncbi:hypothetical protein RJ45_26160 [Photobacterium gaetbulicola]|uniref:Uncharacterized protein n=1 Tax=Photobacterium gaetbulicola TaxID=1295392 RepID=A0A0B9FZ52_9GAMM|nr:DUF4144 family protein [Photobacterium gaetbulicola]KHT57940.1 hypothetical protein RJ45_26160 [Photobacterium gaetbulicola]
MIQWPCIFKLDGDDELLYLASEANLIAEFESLIWSDDDYLIDSQGQGYKVREAQAGTFAYEPCDNPLSVSQVTDLIQAHEFSKAEVCLTKIQFLSVSDAISALAV